jgi:hypothetical protein
MKNEDECKSGRGTRSIPSSGWCLVVSTPTPSPPLSNGIMGLAGVFWFGL